MNEKELNKKEYYTIDIAHIFKCLLRRMWAIILASLIAAGIGFSLASFVIPKKYSSSVMLYVNNSSFSLGNTSFSISSSEITAAQSLVKTYIVILQNRTTLDKVIADSGIDTTFEELIDQINAESVDETEVFKVTVTTEDPEKSARLAESISRVFPSITDDIIEGSSMKVVDKPIINRQKVAPSISTYTAIGFILGFLASVIIVVIAALMDDTIHDEEYILNNYKYPILAKVPDLINSGSKSYSYYYRRKSSYSPYEAYESKKQEDKK